MKLLIFSDIHFEFHKDGGKAFVDSAKEIEHDVVVLAGDLSNFEKLEDSLKLIADNFKHVVYVMGNHEAYYSSISKTHEAIRNFCSKNTSISFLENDFVEINNQRFIGCTLWFPYNINRSFGIESWMNDFNLIKNFRKDIQKINEDSVNYLADNISSDDIVITHHLPSYKCVAPRYKGDELNKFFVCEMDNIIKKTKPKCWIFGHTHSIIDTSIEETRLIARPLGYPGENLSYNLKTIEV